MKSETDILLAKDRLEKGDARAASDLGDGDVDGMLGPKDPQSLNLHKLVFFSKPERAKA